jgi:hypothetical protein
MGGINDSNATTDADEVISRIAGDAGVLADVITDTDGIDKLQVKSSSVPVALGNLFFLEAENGGSADMDVNGSGTPVEFTINAESGPGASDLVVQEMRFTAFDNGIQVDKFLALNSELSNGIDVEVTSQGTVFDFLPIKNTGELESHFSFGPGGKYELIIGSGDDFVTATFSPANPFILEKDTSDKILVRINDNLSQVNKLQFIGFGFRNG